MSIVAQRNSVNGKAKPARLSNLVEAAWPVQLVLLLTHAV
jgi:hypothetical protein